MWFVCRCGYTIHADTYEDLFNSIRKHLFESHKYHIADANYIAREITKKVIRLVEEYD